MLLFSFMQIKHNCENCFISNSYNSHRSESMNVSIESFEEDEGQEKVEKETLDTAIYQPDYVTQLFNQIDWDSRVNKEKREELGDR